MRIPFSKWSPGGNITILLERPLGAKEHMPACAEVLASSHLCAEQSGTVDLQASPPVLRMLGGEFCVNATRSFAALLTRLGKLHEKSDGCFEGSVAVSGVETPLLVRTRKLGEARFEAEARLTLSTFPEITYRDGCALVSLPGITHLLLDAERYPLPSSRLEEIYEDAAAWRERFGLTSCPAAGVIRLDANGASVKELHITPVVWVRDTQTVCLETACGSGSLAAALSQASKNSQDGGVWRIWQPGGDFLTIAFEKSKGEVHAWVGGTVKLLAHGETFVLETA